MQPSDSKPYPIIIPSLKLSTDKTAPPYKPLLIEPYVKSL